MQRLSMAVGWMLVVGSMAIGSTEVPDLAELRVVLANPAIPAEERARRLLEGAAALDQAAQQSGQASDRRSRWSQAVGLLDEFLVKNPTVEAAPVIRFQAAVYRWAEGRSLADQADLNPSIAKNRDEAVRTLDDSTRRFREIPINTTDAQDPFAQNVRYRLAQSIADRSKLDSDGDPKRAALEREALGILDGSLTLPGLRPFARLLRGELSNRLGLYGQAQMEIEQAEKLTPPPPAPALLEAKIAALGGRRQFDEARKAIELAKVGEPLKRLLELRLVLNRRREKPPGRERRDVDAEAFRVAGRLRGETAPDSRRGLMELARAIDEPGPDALPEDWDLLAEGHLRLGDPVRAGRLVAKGADRAEAIGKFELAASLRYKAGAYLFEAGKFTEADRRLSEAIEKPGAPNDLKSRAGMLRALARGRAVATHEVDASKTSYLSALESQVKEYPRDPSTGEARWLLGLIRQTAGRADEALELWEGIAHGHPRWLESRLVIAGRRREAVEAQRINRDSVVIASKMEMARRSLKEALDAARESTEVAALTLELARLELIPDAGRIQSALDASDRALKLAARPEQHQIARIYRMVALAQGGRAVEAEQAAKALARTDDISGLLLALRLLDRSASDADAEAIRRRIGLIARIITSRLFEKIDQIPEASRDEAHLHHARALLFSGDRAGARKEIAAWGGPVGGADDELLRELADTYQRLDAFVLAIDAERFRSSRLQAGSLPWFESRYGMALSLYRADRSGEARQLIDATSILHPDLGGGELKLRFERLRQKIGER